MTWLRRHPAPEPPHDDHGLDEAQAALEEAMARWPEVKETREHMRRLRQENHFAEKVDNFLRVHRR